MENMATSKLDSRAAVSGLYRMVLEPEAVIELVAALDELAEDDVADDTLEHLRSEIAVANALAARIQKGSPPAPVAYALTCKAQRIVAMADANRSFDKIACTTLPGEHFRLKSAEAQRELEEALRTLPPGGMRFLVLEMDAQQPLVTLAVARAPNDLDENGASFMIAAPIAGSWTDKLERALQDFDLTAAELRVLRGLRFGQCAADLSERLGVAESTVRTHIKSLLAKVGVSRQAELVRFREEAMRLSSVIAEQMKAVMSEAGAEPPVFPSGRPRPPRRLITLTNGRRVSYRVFGDAHAPKLAVLHGAQSGSMIPEGYSPAAAQLGLHLIAPDRPGFGQSSPSRQDLSIEEAANETRELLARLGVDAYAVLTLGSSAAVGIELARSDPRARSLTMCSPHFGAALIDGVNPGFGFVLRRNLVRRAPWLMEQISRVMWAGMTWESARTIIRTLLRRSPADLNLLQDSGIDTYFADVVLDAMQAPPDGQMWEARALSHYRLDISDFWTPLTLMFGQDDPITDDQGICRLFASASPRIVRKPGGQLFYYRHWADVLSHAARLDG